MATRKVDGALWDHMVDFAISGLTERLKGKEYSVLDGTLSYFSQSRSRRVELEARVIARLGYNPFKIDKK